MSTSDAIEDDPVVILGGGAAGAAAARTLGKAEDARPIILLTDEPTGPYDRTQLSKAVLLGDQDAATPLFADDLAAAGVHVRTGTTVHRLDLTDRKLHLVDGTDLSYGTLVIATGAEARPLPVPGSRLNGVHDIRTAADAAPVRDALARGDRLVIIGGGLIGLEVAAAARARGCEVTVIEATDQLMGRVVPPIIAATVTDEHREQGVDLQLGVSVEALLDDGDGRVCGARLLDGRQLPADSVVVAIGAQPRTTLAAEAGLAVEDGILVDEHLRTSDPHVLAAGDVVQVVGEDGSVARRTEAWTPAMAMGQHAARVILGEASAPYRDVPWMWSDQHTLKVQAAGTAHNELRQVVRGTVDEPAGLVAFGLEGEVVRSVCGVSRGHGVGRTVRGAMALIQKGTPVTDDELTDPSVELRRLARR
jgi:3-phenylpropionate/trans-cinnamate dioxygenase ferredoxin reductase component